MAAYDDDDTDYGNVALNSFLITLIVIIVFAALLALVLAAAL